MAGAVTDTVAGTVSGAVFGTVAGASRYSHVTLGRRRQSDPLGLVESASSVHVTDPTSENKSSGSRGRLIEYGLKTPHVCAHMCTEILTYKCTTTKTIHKGDQGKH